MEKINYPSPKRTPVGGGLTYVKDSDSVEFNIDNKGELSAEATGKNKAYKSYVALISQSETNAPTAIVLQNDFDTELVFNYQSTGKYFITSEKPIFKQNKTLLFTSGGPGNNLIISAEFSNENTLGFGSINLTQDEPAPSNGFTLTSIEIRVYN